ncbi:hypothetical protein CXF72_01015 [Psychromonas sp. MB-3u-54]|uniref:DUF2189 domain-containing protein n=1 Tax=Psychromonas sp. MB-3u-54 TaxID=2058319 RepID=UPI000C344800|nr:DUF2189 domain-containing protein [Psychromonas sp. MB-3u-54]PKH04489.1 hypothetical protein CXF72_01015 [Psychromonas sp. MB-3u-54]
MPLSPTNKEHNHEYARTIESNKVEIFAPFHWLSLGAKDFIAAPLISLVYGVIFSLIPVVIMYLYRETDNHLINISMTITFTLIAPVFAAALYDISWELEKGHKPSFSHSVKSMFRNPVGAWAFAVIILLIMTAWLRIAVLVYALYPASLNPTFEELLAFLSLGTVLGAVILVAVLVLSAFTPQILLERKVDIMTAIFTSTRAVINNFYAMLVWGLILIIFVFLGFLTSAVGFIVIMPILAFSSWHAYIAVIKTKKKRIYE